MMGIGLASGKSRAKEAAIAAISSPLLESSIEGAKGVVFNITGGTDLTLHEVSAAAEVIYEVVDPNANIIFGAVIDERLQGEIQITVIATGFAGEAPTAGNANRSATVANKQRPTAQLLLLSRAQSLPLTPPKGGWIFPNFCKGDDQIVDLRMNDPDDLGR